MLLFGANMVVSYSTTPGASMAAVEIFVLNQYIIYLLIVLLRSLTKIEQQVIYFAYCSVLDIIKNSTIT
jgi:hypothetical protein